MYTPMSIVMVLSRVCLLSQRWFLFGVIVVQTPKIDPLGRVVLWRVIVKGQGSVSWLTL